MLDRFSFFDLVKYLYRLSNVVINNIDKVLLFNILLYRLNFEILIKVY